MSDALVTYSLSGHVATIAMDDGKANVMSLAMMKELNSCLDRAEKDEAVVVLRGRAGLFSGGYDLAVFATDPPTVKATVGAGGELAARLFEFPRPVIAACAGHAVAQGAFLLLSADVRIAAAGAFKIGLNEVAIGVTIPHYGIELARARLTPPAFHYATVTGVFFNPADAREAGFVDRVVEPEQLDDAVAEAAQALTRINASAHAAIKRRARGVVVERMRAGIREEFGPPSAG